MTGFLFGAGTGDTAASLKRKRELVASLKAQIMGETPKTVAQGVTALLKGAVAGVGQYQLRRQEDAGEKDVSGRLDSLRKNFYSQLVGDSASFPAPEAAGQVSATSPSSSVASGAAPNMTGNEVYSGFMDTVKQGGVQNPYALAAIAATGQRESKFSPGNVNRTWSDPSESGKPGTAGGIMSWRGPRYEALAATGDLSPQGQAKFFLQENPQLIQALNSAKSVEEAQGLMNKAWAFAGHDRPGGETAARLAAAQGFLPTFQGQGQPAQVASLDPSVGMPAMTASQAIEQQAPAGGSLTDEVAQFEQTPEYAAQFPGRQPQQATPQPVQQQPMQQQAQAQPQPMPQAVQPQQQQLAQNGPQQSAQGDAAAMQQIFQMMSSPFVSPEQKQELNFMLEQLTSQQQQSREQQQWMQRQAYERQQQQSDPMYQQKLQAGQLEMEEARTGTWSRLDDGRLYNQRTGEFKEAPAPTNGGMPSDLGLNPQYGTDAEGNPVLLQLGKNGQVVQSKMPEGVQLSKEPIKLDAGTHFVLLDPITRQPVGQIPKNVAGEASQTVEGKALGEARANLGQVEDTGNQVLSTIDSLVNDPYLDNMVGSVQGRLPNFSSDAARVQSKMDQIQGQAFLQAFNTLRGGGQITEIEGKKATDAIAALGTAQDEKDYRQALSNLRGVVATGLDRARQKAGSASPGDASPANADPLAAARDAIAKGAPRDAVIRRLQQSGINSEGF
jgi:hypothetical protein